MFSVTDAHAGGICGSVYRVLLTPRHAPSLPAGDTASPTAACSLGTLAPFTGASVSYIKPSLTYAHEESTCGRDVASVAADSVMRGKLQRRRRSKQLYRGMLGRNVGIPHCGPSLRSMLSVATASADAT